MSTIDVSDPRHVGGLFVACAVLAAGVAWQANALWGAKRIAPPAASSTTAGQGAATAQPHASPEIERPLLEPAARDPFLARAPVAPPNAPAAQAARQAKTAPLPPPPPVPPQPPVAPQPPPLDLRFAGRMKTPQGQTIIFATQGNREVTLSKGLVLPNGYVVKAVSETTVTLEYTALRVEANFDLPPPPAYELR